TTCKKIGKYSCISLERPGGRKNSGRRRSRRRGRLQGRELLRNALVLLRLLFHHATGDQILKLLVSAQPEHFFASAGSISGPQILMHDVEQVLEFKGGL